MKKRSKRSKLCDQPQHRGVGSSSSKKRADSSSSSNHDETETHSSANSSAFTKRANTPNNENDDEETLIAFSSKLVIDLHPPMTPPSDPPPFIPSEKPCSLMSKRSVSLKLTRTNHIFSFRADEKPRRDLENDSKFNRITQDFASSLRLGKILDAPEAIKRTQTRSKRGSGKLDARLQLSRNSSQKSWSPCWSTLLPCELWLAVISHLPPKTVLRLLRVCKLLSQLAFDPLYWRAVCASAGVDCALMELFALKRGVAVGSFSLTSQVTTSSFPMITKSTSDDLLLNKLNIQDEEEPVQTKNGLKRSFEQPKVNPLPRRRRIVSETRNASMIFESLKWWTFSSTTFFPSPKSSYIPTSAKQQHLSWLRVYTSQIETRKTYLQSPYTFRRLAAAHAHGITCLKASYSPESTRIITGAWDGCIKVWKLVECEPVSSEEQRALEKICWDEIASGRCLTPLSPFHITSASEDEYLTDAAEGSMWESGNDNDGLGFGDLVDQAGGSSPAHSSLYTSEKMWLGSGKYELELESTIETLYPIECMAIKGDNIVTGGRGQISLTLHSLSRGQTIKNLLPPRSKLAAGHRINPSHVTRLEMNEHLIVSVQKQSINVWSIRTGTLLGTITHTDDANISGIAIFPTSETPHTYCIVESCAFGSITLWKFEFDPSKPIVASKSFEHTITPIPDQTRTTPTPEISSSTFTVHGPIQPIGAFETTPGINTLDIRETAHPNTHDILCGFKDGNLRSWRVVLNKGALFVSSTGALCSLGDWITSVHADPLAAVVIAGAWDGRIRVWDERKRALRRSLVSDVRSAVLCLEVVGDLLIAGSYNGSLVVYDFSKGKHR